MVVVSSLVGINLLVPDEHVKVHGILPENERVNEMVFFHPSVKLLFLATFIVMFIYNTIHK